MNTITKTNYYFPNQKSIYKGKVRDVYTLNSGQMVMVATDRISAFDVVMPRGIPYKGQILNRIAANFMKKTEDIVPNWLLATPHPNVSIGYACEPFKVEMVIRAYLVGHAAREYASGNRRLCGLVLPEGLKENDRLPKPIITPTTKAFEGQHDEDISKEDILNKSIVSEKDYQELEKYTYQLFERGTQIAAQRGLILVDTKYEFGKNDKGQIVLIDEVHTPDSSRYFFEKEYSENQKKSLPQKQLSKEFVRQWLIQNNFQGKKGQVLPEMSDDYITEVSNRYIELFEKITGEKFVKPQDCNIEEAIELQVNRYLKTL